VGIRDGVDAVGDSRFQLGEPLAQAGCKRGADFVKRAYGRRCSAGPPCDGGEARAVGEWVHATLAHALTLATKRTASKC